MEKDIYILGVEDNTIVYIDLIERCGYRVARLYYYETERIGELYFGHKIIGDYSDLFRSQVSGTQYLISVGNNQFRASIYDKIQAHGGKIPTIIDPLTIVSRYAKLGQGVVILANSVISPDVVIGDNSIISSNDLIACGSRIGSHCLVASNVVVGAYVKVQDFVFIGLGSTLVSGEVSKIGAMSRIGAGAVVFKDILPHGCVFGNPAKNIYE